MKHLAVAAVLIAMACGATFADEPTRFRVFTEDVPEGLPKVTGVRAITTGPKHHFCGYYGIFPWDPTGRYLFCLESDFSDRDVTPDDRATLGLIDLETGAFKPLALTAAWNFQQGCLTHWLDADRLIYNDRIDGAARAVVLEWRTGEKRLLPRAIAAVSPDGALAASISYARLAITRPGYGYQGLTESATQHAHPDDDGLYIMDVATGETKLIVTLDQVFNDRPLPEQRGDDMIWFNHVLFSRDGGRIFFLARFKEPTGRLISAAYTVAPDGSDLRCIIPYEWNNSHYDWRNATQIMSTTRYQAGDKWLHVLLTDGKDDHRVIAPDLLGSDGHGHFSPDGVWMVSDSYPRGAERMQSFYLVHVDTDRGYEAAQFHQPRDFKGPWRCDLHPRWSRDGSQVCIDSTHDGTRQVYLVDLEFPGAATASAP